MADNALLRMLVENSIDRKMLEAVAAEDAKGRMLLVATTNLDVRRPVIWNFTKIARSGAPERWSWCTRFSSPRRPSRGRFHPS